MSQSESREREYRSESEVFQTVHLFFAASWVKLTLVDKDHSCESSTRGYLPCRNAEECGKDPKTSHLEFTLLFVLHHWSAQKFYEGRKDYGL